MSSQRRTALGGDVDHPADKRTNPDGMNRRMKKLKNLKHYKRRIYSAKVKPTDQTGMKREGNIITLTRGAVI
jgi:hypothetical protein